MDSAANSKRRGLRLPSRLGLGLIVALIALAVSVGLGLSWRGERDAARQELTATRQDLSATANRLQAQIDQLHRTLTEVANFTLVQAQFTGPCDATSCPASATFTNQGGPGSAVAIFTIQSQDKTQDLASCSAVIGAVGQSQASAAACTASSSQLRDYWLAHPSAKVYLRVTVENPNPPPGATSG